MPGLVAKICPTVGSSDMSENQCGVAGAERSAAPVFLVLGRRLGSAPATRPLFDDTSHFSGNEERARDTDKVLL